MPFLLPLVIHNALRYTRAVIKSFLCKETASLWRGDVSRKLPRDIQQVARRKLRLLNNAQSLDDLRVPPNNRLEKLRGDLSGYYSIRVNDQWRIRSRWADGASEVRMVDYH